MEEINPLLVAWREAKDKLQYDGITDETYSGIKLEVMSLAVAEEYVPGSNEVCISIYAYENKDWNGTTKPTGLSNKFEEILYIQFDDYPDLKHYDKRFETAIQITESQAEQIAKFVYKNINRSKIVIHCFAGASRSRSMAAAIANVFKLPYDYTVLNKRVYSLVRRALEKELGSSPQKITLRCIYR